MRSIVSVSLAAALAALALLGASALPANAAPIKTLSGSVGPDFTIGLTLGGKKVTKLKAGVPYRFTIVDRSAAHDFHLTGPGVSKVITGVGFTGTKSVVLKLRKGTYSYVCDPHASLMRGTFRVA